MRETNEIRILVALLKVRKIIFTALMRLTVSISFLIAACIYFIGFQFTTIRLFAHIAERSHSSRNDL